MLVLKITIFVNIKLVIISNEILNLFFILFHYFSLTYNSFDFLYLFHFLFSSTCTKLFLYS